MFIPYCRGGPLWPPERLGGQAQGPAPTGDYRANSNSPAMGDG